MKRLLFVICMFSLGFTMQVQGASVPKLINYQGSLLDAQGQPLPTADYTLEFSLYDSPASTNRIWGPQVFDGATDPGHGAQVPVVQGYFNVILGPVDADATPRSLANAFTEADRYLEITVNGGQPILPRQRILSTPYALKAAGGVPVGGIVPFAGSAGSIPSNWRLCDGSLINDPESPLNGALLPSLNGRFLRGSHISGVYGGSDNHSHSYWGSTSSVYFPMVSGNGATGGYSPANSGAGYDNTLINLNRSSTATNPYNSHGHINGSASISGTTYGASSLPSFFSVNYIIRIK